MIPGLPSYYDGGGAYDKRQAPDRALARLHKLIINLDGVCVQNPTWRPLFGITPETIHDIGNVMRFVAGSLSERRGRESIKRCRAKRLPVKASPKGSVLYKVKQIHEMSFLYKRRHEAAE